MTHGSGSEFEIGAKDRDRQSRKRQRRPDRSVNTLLSISSGKLAIAH